MSADGTRGREASLGRRDFLRDTLALIAVGKVMGDAAEAQARTPATMLTLVIPRTGEQLPVVGVGTWQTFDPPQLTPAVLAEL